MAVLSLLGLLFPVRSSSQSQGGDYMSQYAAPHQQYMQGASGSGSDGYQKYYSKYTSEYGSGGGGYDKYMSKYAGNYAAKYMPSSESGKSSEDAEKAVSFAAAEVRIAPLGSIGCKSSAPGKEFSKRPISHPKSSRVPPPRLARRRKARTSQLARTAFRSIWTMPSTPRVRAPRQGSGSSRHLISVLVK